MRLKVRFCLFFITLRIYEKNYIFQKLQLVCTSVVVAWFVSWTPYLLVHFSKWQSITLFTSPVLMQVFLLPRIGHSTLVTAHMDMVPAVLCKLSAAVNPLIYGLL